MTTKAISVHYKRGGQTALAVIRIVLGCALLLGGLSKLHSPYAFLATLDQFELFGPRSALAIAVVLPFLELTLGICLLVGLAPAPLQCLRQSCSPRSQQHWPPWPIAVFIHPAVVLAF